MTRQVPDKYPTSIEPSTPQVEILIKTIGKGQLSVKEMLEASGLKDRENFLNLYLAPAMNNGIVRMLYPESPRHPRQKYLLTVKGLMALDLISK